MDHINLNVIVYFVCCVLCTNFIPLREGLSSPLCWYNICKHHNLAQCNTSPQQLLQFGRVTELEGKVVMLGRVTGGRKVLLRELLMIEKFMLGRVSRKVLLGELLMIENS